MTSATANTQLDAPTPLAKWELVILAAVLLLAVVCRFALPENLAVEHFDEGVYASNIWFGDRPEGAYPAQQLYAPPLLPAMIEWGFVFLGPSNAGAMWPSQLAGVLSVLLLWRLGRSWFGPVAGLIAAGLSATNDVLILLSRSALTDSLLGFWWLAAIWSLGRACKSGRPLDRLAAGLLVGLAWYTKYNGWMPLGIVIGAVIVRGVCCRGIWRQTRSALVSCLIAGLIAFATWSPWLWSLQSKGGYASVTANHRQYIVGPSGWMASATRQYGQLSATLGSLTHLGLDGAYLAILLGLVWSARSVSARPSVRPGDPSQLAGAPVSTTTAATRPLNIAVYVGGFGLLQVGLFAPALGLQLLTAQALLVWAWQAAFLPVGPRRPDRHELGYWILLVWFAGLSVATPLYTPYLRLTLPWLLATCLGLGLALQQIGLLLWREFSAPSLTWFRVLLTAVQALQFFAVIMAGSGRPATNLTDEAPRPAMLNSLPDQSTLPAASRAMAAAIGSEAAAAGQQPSLAVVYVYAEPSLLFQLRNAGVENVAPVSSLNFAQSQVATPGVRIYLAVGIHAQRDPRFQEQFAQVRRQLREVGHWPWHLGPLVALDQTTVNPKRLGRDPAESTTVQLYEVLAP